VSHDQIVHVQRLCAHYDGLRTFDDVAQWDAAALDAAMNLQRLADQTLLHHQGLVTQADDLARARAATPFFKRLFSSRNPELALRGQADQASAVLRQVGAMINDLLERIDYTPNDEKERKALLKELKAEKKELQLQKKEIAAQKREINQAAREASAKAGLHQGWIFTTYDSKQAASERRAIRRQKIAMLAPHENAKTLIERQILDIERRIVWVERFGKGED
jgi:hypothetical protein